MSTAEFCDCGSILDQINLNTGIRLCTKCKKSYPLGNDKTIMYFTNNENASVREITTLEVQRLATQPTTQRIIGKCTNCKFNILAAAATTEYKFKFACIKCYTAYDRLPEA